MAASVLTDSLILAGGTDITLDTGSYTVGGQVAMVDANVHGSGRFRRVLPGNISHTLQVGGTADYDANQVNLAFPPSALGNQYLTTIVPQNTSSTGDVALFSRGLLASMNAPGGARGDLATFDMQIGGDVPLIGGQVLAPLAARTTTGNSSVLALTGPTSAQRLYCGLHITAVSGTASPTLTVTVQSSTVVGMTSPTTRFTFSAATAAGWQWATPLAGAITDGFYRATFTISGATPSFTAAVVIGVL